MGLVNNSEIYSLLFVEIGGSSNVDGTDFDISREGLAVQH